MTVTDSFQQSPHNFKLGISDFTYADLYAPARLAALSEQFDAWLRDTDSSLASEFETYRSARGAGYTAKAESHLLVRVAPHLGRFIARLFGVTRELDASIKHAERETVIFEFKKKFVQGRVRRLLTTIGEEAVRDFPTLDPAIQAMRAERLGPLNTDDEELAIARLWKSMGEDRALLGQLEKWLAAIATRNPERFSGWVSWKHPHTLDYGHLVEIERREPDVPESILGPDRNLRRRDGFHLTDLRMGEREILNEVHYCLYCHERDKDSCSSGLAEKDGSIKSNPLGIALNGCPLDEKISEAHMVRRDGDFLGALALVAIDNPMCPGTGHRICNDCMKACIFQKQEPVNIPQIETGILTDVLKLPYGVEIFGLLTRWNPLNVKRPHTLAYNGKNVLVVGMGPAGYTLSHYLLNEGFGVVGIDGLKIEPLPPEWTGNAGTALPKPIREWNEIYRDLQERVLEGFGGVSEYGITVRWDKNFLTLIHLTLARNSHMRIYGGVRFGGTLTIEDAWSLGFDHIAIATGAGKPTVIGMKNNLIRGIRKASDFLMALQLTGAFKENALANLQVQLPAIVIGGGLTGIDTTTEIAAYYPIQVEKIFERYQQLTQELGTSSVMAMYDEEEKQILMTFVAHGEAVRQERQRASDAGEDPDFVKLVRAWGGVTMVYRKTLQDSPAYRLNHEEVTKSLEEGIRYVECMNPVEAIADNHGALAAVRFERQRADESGRWSGTGEFVTLAAKTMCVAAGTSPNVIYEKERPGTFRMDRANHYFQGHRWVRNGTPRLQPVDSGKEAGFFTSYDGGGRYITFYGDNHPNYAGNVVKAMASAKDGYRHVVELFAEEVSAIRPDDQPRREAAFLKVIEKLDGELSAVVERVVRLTPTIVEVIVRAPMASRKFHPGQFYRLQNYESVAPERGGAPLTMEGLALTGAWTDPEAGLLSLIVLEMGASSRLCATLKPGEPVVVMGPTGTPTEIPQNETVLLAGGGLGNAVLFSIARALKANGNRVIYFAGYRHHTDVFKRTDIEAATDQVIWSTDRGELVPPGRPQDATFSGNIVQAMRAYAAGDLGTPLFEFCKIDRIIAIGSDRMMNAIRVARKNDGALAKFLKPDHVAIGSINSPMQCMMKEVCAQCLQKHVDPESGKEAGYVFSCFNQDQLLDAVDFANLSDRLRLNTVQEKLSNLWLQRTLATEPVQQL